MQETISSAVVTGCTGGIGSALVSALAQRGVTVWALVRPRSSRRKNIAEDARVHVVECDASAYDSLAGAEMRADAFFHLAWEKTAGAGRDDLECQLDNVRHALGAVRLAGACGCRVFVGAGSQAEYGIQSAPLTPDTPAEPLSGYGIAKFAAGRMTRNLCARSGIRHVWMRILSTFGPRDGENTLISYLIGAIAAGQAPQLTPCGQIWDYLSFSDAADALIAAAERGKDGKAYPLGSGSPRPLKEYVLALRDKIDKSVPVHFGARPYYPYQPMFLAADISQLKEDTGWEPKHTFEEGIEEIVGRKTV